MTDFEQPNKTPENLFPGQDEHGVDVTLLKENLKLTPLERLLRLQAAANAILLLRSTGQSESN